MKITACPRCGSDRIVFSNGEDAIKVCRDCDWYGNFLEFDSERDYQIFYNELKKQKKNDEIIM